MGRRWEAVVRTKRFVYGDIERRGRTSVRKISPVIIEYNLELSTHHQGKHSSKTFGSFNALNTRVASVMGYIQVLNIHIKIINHHGIHNTRPSKAKESQLLKRQTQSQQQQQSTTADHPSQN